MTRDNAGLSKPLTRTRYGLFALSVVSALAVCTSCSPSSPALEGPYAEEYAQAIEGTDSEFVKEILSDGVIKEAEFLEAVSKTNVCLDESGTGVILIVDEDYASAGWQYPDDQQIPARDEAVEECSDAWFGEIGNLFLDALENPNNEDWEDLVAACLVRHGIAPEGFTGDMYEELNYRPENQGTVTWDEETGEMVYTPPLELSYGVELPDGSVASNEDPEVWGCMDWPLR